MATAAARPIVSVQSLEGEAAPSVPLPDVMKASIRPDIVNFVHSNISRNSRQPYAVSKRVIKVLKQIGAFNDAEKAKNSRGIRSGKGENEELKVRKGPLVLYGTEGAKAVKAFRNIPGVDVVNVDRLNLLKLAPGGHLGRFVIWTKTAFEKLDFIHGSFEEVFEKKGYLLPRPKMVNSYLGRIINSDEVQSMVRPIKKKVKRATLKNNVVNSVEPTDIY